MKINFKDHSVLTLIVVNLFPILGVIIFGWDIFEVVMLYVIETIIIGTYNVIKMLFVKGDKKRFTIMFFIIHYNFFILIQSIFVIVLIGGDNDGNMGPDVGQGFHNLFSLFSFRDFKIAVLLMVISQGIAVYKHFIKPKLYQHADLEKLMMEPYKRIFVQQFMAIGGSFIVMMLQAPMGFLIILILMKTFFDLRAYHKTHDISKT
ncbi:MAG: hypothetical protein DRJ10_07750 [Bacteroidetes bacterium]|nr:MAG: hypothetical protein DRJ10_07750 [Bacteroidota bacterium]RLD83849.1 MAG: hypothetical protein DRJ07_05900 [Bacteroidota bacterium]